jgi:hypothetical protein
MSSPRREDGTPARGRLFRILGTVLYWFLVLLVSLALVVVLVLLLESRDASDIADRGAELTSRAVTPGWAAP